MSPVAAPSIVPSPSMRITPDLARKRYDFLYSQSFSLAAAVGAPQQIEIKTQQDSWFVVQTLMYAKATGAAALIKARVSDDGTGIFWQGNLTQADNTFGSAQEPGILVIPALIRPTSRILIDLQNQTAIATTGEFVLGGYKIFAADVPEWTQGPRPDVWFQYSGAKAILAGNLDSFTIKLQADSHFEVHKMIALATGAFEARVSDSATGKTWSDRFINGANQFGTAKKPRVLPFPKLLLPNTTVQVEVRDLSGVGNTIEVVLEGAKRYTV